jgi:hypothetical protein
MGGVDVFGLPILLWRDQKIHVPPVLSEAYAERLRALKLYDQMMENAGEGEIGGAAAEDAVGHFSHRFLASATRVQYLLLDPDGRLKGISADLASTLSDGTVAVLDAPCGAGAGLLSLTSTLACLRCQNALARLPLRISVTAGDVSDEALRIYSHLADALTPVLRRVGIQLERVTARWDAASEESTAALVDRWFRQAPEAEEHVVLISAFSGAAASHFQEYARSFQHIAARLHDRVATALWIEPDTNKAGTFFTKLVKLLNRLSWRENDCPSEGGVRFRWWHPFKRVHPAIPGKAARILRKK